MPACRQAGLMGGTASGSSAPGIKPSVANEKNFHKIPPLTDTRRRYIMSNMQSVKTIANSFLNLFYPLHCLGCARPLEADNEFHVCDNCISSINGNAMPPFELDDIAVKAYSAAIYDSHLKELIHKFKYKGKTVLGRIFSKLMLDYIRDNPEIANADIITVVPLHRERLKQREYNQSLIIARGIAKELSIPIMNIMDKPLKTRYQNELMKSERMENLKGAFAIRHEANIKGRNILLIDDVMTTGATLNECAKIILKNGAKNVTCYTLARGI